MCCKRKLLTENGEKVLALILIAFIVAVLAETFAGYFG